jgi:hypothetical protein
LAIGNTTKEEGSDGSSNILFKDAPTLGYTRDQRNEKMHPGAEVNSEISGIVSLV